MPWTCFWLPLQQRSQQHRLKDPPRMYRSRTGLWPWRVEDFMHQRRIEGSVLGCSVVDVTTVPVYSVAASTVQQLQPLQPCVFSWRNKVEGRIQWSVCYKQLVLVTAVAVVLASAHRALTCEKELRSHYEGDTLHPLSSSQILTLPIKMSGVLLIMFYFFPYVALLVWALLVLCSALALAFTIEPYVIALNVWLGDSVQASQSCWGPVTRSDAMLGMACVGVVAGWMITGHWLLYNALGISLCILMVSLIPLPNLKVASMLTVGMLVYDVFWVFFSKHVFGSNVMSAVSIQQILNPVRTIYDTWKFQKLSRGIAPTLDIPRALKFPLNLLWSSIPYGSHYLILGLGDMAFPGMVLSLALCYDHRNVGEYDNQGTFSRGYKYIRYGACGYAAGMIVSNSVLLLSLAPQPVILYVIL